MKIKSNFLSLSIREQICIVIIALTFFSILVILCLACSFCYEILKEDYKQKKIYFYDRYKDLIETSFYFQNFFLLQYEEIIKRMQMQLFKYHHNSTLAYSEFRTSYPYNSPKSILQVYEFNSTEHKNISENSDSLFVLFYGSKEEELDLIIIYVGFLFYYHSISSMIFSHDIDKSFRIPGYDIPILKSPLVICPEYKIGFSFNGTYIYESLRENNCNFTNRKTPFVIGDFHIHYTTIIETMKADIFVKIKDYYTKSLFLFDHMFEKASNEMTFLDEIQNIYRSGTVGKLESFNTFLEAVSGYYSTIHLETNKFELISKAGGAFFYFEATMIPDYLFFIHKRLSNYLNISFIPIYSDNSTIISRKLCLKFLLEQYNYELNEEQINEIYNNLIIGVSKITDCFINKNIFKKQQDINKIFDLNLSSFLLVDNLLYQGIINTNKYPYYYIKYSFPNYNSLKDFRSDYLLLDQINFYLFVSFKDPIVYSDFVLQINKNIFFLIIIIVLVTWIICLFVNLIIFNKVIVQLTEPIVKLQEAIESSSIKDENIFRYEYDDFINDLFLTSKELLSGQIDRNNGEKGLMNFNILSESNNKENIDKNLYQRNLLIDNDIMDLLIMEQQNTMDFSKNIQTNYLLNKNFENNDSDKDIISIKKKIQSNHIYDNKLILNLNDGNKEKEKENEKDNISNKNKTIKSNEEKDKEPYKQLFKISEYLYYYQSKIEKNYIHIVNNLVKDESKKSNISKISSNISPNSSLKISTNKLKNVNYKGDNHGKTDDNDNITINMLRNKNISYLWYMEAKKKKNKSINYQTNRNYDELFNDYNTYNSNYDSIKKSLN